MDGFDSYPTLIWAQCQVVCLVGLEAGPSGGTKGGRSQDQA
jgi:hypothetical protein